MHVTRKSLSGDLLKYCLVDVEPLGDVTLDQTRVAMPLDQTRGPHPQPPREVCILNPSKKMEKGCLACSELLLLQTSSYASTTNAVRTLHSGKRLAA